MSKPAGIGVDRAAQAWLLFTVCLAYGLGLWHAPIDLDQLILFTSVAEVRHPFGYFAGYWGYGNNLYRPLFSSLHWLEYRAFGVEGWPYQLLSLLLYLLVAALVFELIVRVGSHRSPALRFLLGLIAVVSPYTASAATWVADRSSTMAGLCLLLLVRHLYLTASPPRVRYIAVLSLAAVMSRETGLLAPAFVVLYGWSQKRPRLVALGAAIIIGYGLLRLTLFGADATRYPESGVLLGYRGYDDSSDLSAWAYAWMLIENPIKHVVAAGLPWFDDDGGIRTGLDLWRFLPLWLATAVMAAAASGRLSAAQKLAMTAIVLNAAIHFAVFRFRTMFLAHLAFIVYVAASPALAVPWRRRLVTSMAVVVLVANVVWVEYDLLDALAPQFADVSLLDGLDGDSINPAIWEAVRRIYFP